MAIESQHGTLSLLRLALGLLQMAGAVCSGVLLYETGISTVTLGVQSARAFPIPRTRGRSPATDDDDARPSGRNAGRLGVNGLA